MSVVATFQLSLVDLLQKFLVLYPPFPELATFTIMCLKIVPYLIGIVCAIVAHERMQIENRAMLAKLLTGAGPDADRRAKLLIYQAMEGSILGSDAILMTRCNADSGIIESVQKHSFSKEGSTAMPSALAFAVKSR